MLNPAIFPLAARSIWNRKATAILTILSVALAVMLFSGVQKIRTSVEDSFARTISGTDMIVGARTAPINLVLYSVFRIGDPTNNIRWTSYEAIAGLDGVEWTVPISLGDSHRGYRVVGTNGDYVTHYRYGDDQSLTLSDGAWFDDVFDAVMGAQVAATLGYEVGDTIVLSHGLGAADVSGSHRDKPFVVSGILAPTGTPVDTCVHVSLQGIEAIHVGWQAGSPTAAARAVSPEDVRNMDLQPREITAMLVGTTSYAATFQLQRRINTARIEPLSAVLPGTALQDLWRLVGHADRAMAAISAFVIAVGLMGILSSILTSLNERRREMAILRSVGARPVDVFSLMVLEATGIAGVGAALGLGALYLAGLVIGPMAQARLGVSLTAWGPGLYDLGVWAGVTGLAFILGFIPAWQALRRSLADGLTVKL